MNTKLTKLSQFSPAEKESLLKEADRMKSLVFDFVLRIYGLYDGTPFKGTTRLRGIVMEYMGRGSVETLQEKLAGPLPLPLAFRLAHQVALGINFLHLKGVLHQDLKPSNVLLTDELNAKVKHLPINLHVQVNVKRNSAVFFFFVFCSWQTLACPGSPPAF